MEKSESKNWIETGISPPSERLLLKARECGAKVFHVPALEVEILPLKKMDLSEFPCAFVGSVKAASCLGKILSRYRGKIFAAGEETFKALLQEGVSAADFGKKNGGVKKTLEEVAKKNGGVFPYSKIAWFSAEETAVDKETLAKELKIEIIHFPVYRTKPSVALAEQLSKINSPKLFFLRSGKGVRAIFPHIDFFGDEIFVENESAKKAIEEIFPDKFCQRFLK